MKDAVRFTGRIPPEEVAPYYLLADVSVDPVYDNPAQRARSPLKVVESLAVGTPVVTGDVGDRSMYLKGEGAGKLVVAGDAASLACGIVSVLEGESSPENEEVGGSGRSDYFWDVLVHEFVQVYELGSARA
jgi:glycosyltransferase involved in cell wall biosynthesis